MKTNRLSNALLPGAASIEVASLPELVYTRLRDAIISGAFDAGRPLRQEEIALNLGVSRVPVREALTRLETEGLVLQRPRRGYVVTSLNQEEIEDIFDIRMMLEERAAYLATKRRAASDIAHVERLVRAMDGMDMKDAAYFQLMTERNRAFHAKLFEVSGRPQLCRVMLVLRNSIERYIRVGGTIAAGFNIAHAEHHRIFDAFRRGDADEAAHLSREHCRHTYERLAAKLRLVREK